jgi:ankyrin repeat protein
MVVLVVAPIHLSAAPAERPLIQAVKQGNTATVRALVSKGTNVNASAVDGTTALHWAVQDDNEEMVKLLLRAGAKVQTAATHGVSPLTLACINGNPKTIKLLLDAGADPNVALPEGETAIMTAARTGNVAAARTLLEYGADVTARERWRGQDALTWAAAEAHLGMAKLLIEYGAPVNTRSKGGFSPLTFAVRQGHRDMVRLLLDAGANINDTTSEEGVGASPLIMAIYNADWDLAEYLLERGADPNTSTPGYAPLHLAIQVRNPDVDRDPDAVQTARTGTTGTLDSLDIIRSLLKHGANPNVRMKKAFVDLGSPPDMPVLGATPLFLAAKGADAAVMRLLLAAGVKEPLMATEAGSNPLMAAAGVGYQQGRSTGTEGEALDAVKLMVELGADVNAANANGFTALHGAVIRGANSIVAFLAEHGATLSPKDKRGRTPLTIAEEGAGDSQQRRQLKTAAFLRQLIQNAN